MHHVCPSVFVVMMSVRQRGPTCLLEAPQLYLSWEQVVCIELSSGPCWWVLEQAWASPGLLIQPAQVQRRGSQQKTSDAARFGSPWCSDGWILCLQLVTAAGQGLCPPHVWEHQICFGLWQHYCKVISLFRPCDSSRQRGERLRSAAWRTVCKVWG